MEGRRYPPHDVVADKHREHENGKLVDKGRAARCTASQRRLVAELVGHRFKVAGEPSGVRGEIVGVRGKCREVCHCSVSGEGPPPGTGVAALSAAPVNAGLTTAPSRVSNVALTISSSRLIARLPSWPTISPRNATRLRA